MLTSEQNKILEKFVKQPPASPAVQYLRDIEWYYALKFMNRSDFALDIASEINITLQINAKTIIRIDFSNVASERAKKVLDGKVSEFLIADPEKPMLPFVEKKFDAVVSIGPYDFKFLDIVTLTKEVNRILIKDGKFVFSVPTVKSPYCTKSSIQKFRYYNKSDFEYLIRISNLIVKNIAYIYQPKIIYSRYLNNRYIPSWVQWFITLPCWWISKIITTLRINNLASYIVIELKKN